MQRLVHDADEMDEITERRRALLIAFGDLQLRDIFADGADYALDRADGVDIRRLPEGAGNIDEVQRPAATVDFTEIIGPRRGLHHWGESRVAPPPRKNGPRVSAQNLVHPLSEPAAHQILGNCRYGLVT